MKGVAQVFDLGVWIYVIYLCYEIHLHVNCYSYKKHSSSAVVFIPMINLPQLTYRNTILNDQILDVI